MARLIIVAGASGAGKSFLLKELNRLRGEVKPIKKTTTRPPRQNEPSDTSLDLIFNSTDAQVQNCDYVYSYYRHNYGIKKSDIDKVLMQGKSPIVIVARCHAIEQMRRDYRGALILYAQTVLSGEDLQKELEARGDLISVEERTQRQRNALNDYTKYIEKKLFNYVIINDFTDEFMSQIQSIFEIERIRGVDANYIFCVMSFDKRYNEIYEAYKIAGQCVNGSNKIVIQRVDDKNPGGFVITEKIESSIEKAGLILCDVSEMSPNVFYEFGYARARNKDIIITAQKGTKLPFDISHYKTVFYTSPMDLQTKIIDEIKSHYNINH